MDAIVKVYVTEDYDAIKRHSNVSAILRTTATGVTALSKNLHSEMKGLQENGFIMGLRGK